MEILQGVLQEILQCFLFVEFLFFKRRSIYGCGKLEPQLQLSACALCQIPIVSSFNIVIFPCLFQSSWLFVRVLSCLMLQEELFVVWENFLVFGPEFCVRLRILRRTFWLLFEFRVTIASTSQASANATAFLWNCACYLCALQFWVLCE